MTLHFNFALFFAVFSFFTSNAQAQEAERLHRIELNGGSVLVGEIILKDETTIILKTEEAIEIKIDRNKIRFISETSAQEATSDLSDPKATRLLFSPTGRPLKKGKGYFTDFFVVLPGISYGLTDKLSFMAGMSLVPGVGLGDQLKYFAPRYSFYQNENNASAAGFLNVFVNGGNSAGIAFASHTIGKPDKSLTAAIGWGYLKEESESLEFYKYPVLAIGGNIRLNSFTSFVTENWILTNTHIKYYPFVGGLRFFTKRFSVDLGVLLMGEILEQGFPLPWLSFAYHFN